LSSGAIWGDPLLPQGGCWLTSRKGRQETLRIAWRIGIDIGGTFTSPAKAKVAYFGSLGDLLGEDFDLVQKDNLYRCLDKLLTHKTDLFSFVQQRWKTLFQSEFDVLLYDLTSTYFGQKARNARI
jgi:hypothetical protein